MIDAAAQYFVGNRHSTVWAILSPAGRVSWPHLQSPDTRFDRIGFWSLRLNVEAADAAPLLNAIRHAVAQAKNAAPNTPRASLPYTQEDDGSYTLTVKAKAWPKAEPPRVFDTKGQPVAASFVKDDSLARVRVTLISFSGPRTGVGVTLRLQEVHLVDETSR